MLDLIFAAMVFSTLLLLAISLESCPPSATFSRGIPTSGSKVSRYFIIALLSFPVATFARLKAAERVLQRLGIRLLSHAGMFSGRPYLSEILLSALVSVILLGCFAARRVTLRLLRRTAKPTALATGSRQIGDAG